MGCGDRRSLRLSEQVKDGPWRQESLVVIRIGSLCSRVVNGSCISNKAEGRLVDLPLRMLWLEAAMSPTGSLSVLSFQLMALFGEAGEPKVGPGC